MIISNGIKVYPRYTEYNNTHKSQNNDRRVRGRGTNAIFRVSHERFRVRANGICDPLSVRVRDLLLWSVVHVRDRHREGVRRLSRRLTLN